MSVDSKRRWRLVLGHSEGETEKLTGADVRLDRTLDALYGDGADGPGPGGLGASAPRVARWMGDVRSLFPKDVVRVMQKDAFDRLGLAQMLFEPEMLEAVQPDVDLVATLLSLKRVIPTAAKESARAVVRQVVDELVAKLEQPMRDAVMGSVDRSARRRRPRYRDIDWGRTVLANLKHYQPTQKTVVVERLVGYGRRRASLRDVVLCLDQSGSMARSVIYGSLFAAVLASMPSVRTSLVVFDTSVVDLTEELREDPVDLLFGVQLGGGTDINRAFGYCRELIERPEDTILVLISDLYEGGNRERMLEKAARMVASGVQVIALLALDDAGAPWYDREIAAAFANLSIPAFACTPKLFPELMAAAISRREITAWASERGLVTTRTVR